MDEFLPHLFFAIGVGFVVYCRIMTARVRRSYSWPATTGTITRSEVAWQSRRHGGRIYKAEIEYSYRVGIREHRANRICVGGTIDTSLRRRAEARCAKYPPDATVRVFYDPSNPRKACLEKAAEGTELFTLMGYGFMATSALVYFDVLPFR